MAAFSDTKSQIAALNSKVSQQASQIRQLAARVSDQTAFFYLGKLIEFAGTQKIFMNPSNPQTESYVSGHFG